MGSVLENGLYLPDEGERNAYNGLKGNWNTLDNLVETVTALSSTGLIRKKVDALPITDIQTNVIYMLKATKPNGDVYRIEYMYIDDHWDPVGTSETTLDDYYTKTETDDLPAVKSGINATKVSNYDTHLADTDIHVSLANKQTWDGKQNALDTAQTAAVNSGITGTKVTGYDTHVSDTDIHVTASDKTAWNSKQDGLSQTQLAAVNSGVNATKVTGYDNHIADTDVHVTTVDKATWNGKQDALTQTQLDNIATIPDKANSVDLATVATSGSYTDLINAPTIPTVNNATLTIQKNGTDVATFTANASSNVTANLSIPVNTSDLNNDAGFLTQHNPIDDELSATSVNALQNKVVKSELDGKAPLVHTHAASDVTSGTFNIARIPNLDASKITSGTIDIARLPKGSLERLIKVANQAARYALTTDDVQLGDTVQQLDTGVMYVVTDDTKLDSADGYTEFTAGSASSVPWTGVTGKPSSFTPSSHTHGNVTNDGKLPTASRALISDSSKKITVSSVSDTELGYLSGVTSAIQTQLNGKAASNHVHGSITNDGKLGTASRALVTNSSKKIAVSTVTSTELGYLSGVTSAVQTQLNGKASSTHVHGNITNDGKVGTAANKPLITGTGGVVQAGSFGTSANTFCEGNDSRLSDARTPLSHTHTKSDVTDLLNSNFIPSANNSYDLGSSSYQWNNVYAKGYYYNGTAWGLDQNNTWTGRQTYGAYIKSFGEARTDEWSGNSRTNAYLLSRRDTDDVSGFLISTFRSNAAQGTAGHIYGWDILENSIRYSGLRFTIDWDSTLNSGNGAYRVTLGTNTQGTNPCNDLHITQLKTINSINPGALSLPKGGTTENVDYYNIATAIKPSGGTSTNFSGAINYYQPTIDGWLSLVVTNCTDLSVWETTIKYGSITSGASRNRQVMVPVLANHTYEIAIQGSAWYSARLMPCQGNV